MLVVNNKVSLSNTEILLLHTNIYIYRIPIKYFIVALVRTTFRDNIPSVFSPCSEIISYRALSNTCIFSWNLKTLRVSFTMESTIRNWLKRVPPSHSRLLKKSLHVQTFIPLCTSYHRINISCVPTKFAIVLESILKYVYNSTYQSLELNCLIWL